MLECGVLIIKCIKNPLHNSRYIVTIHHTTDGASVYSVPYKHGDTGGGSGISGGDGGEERV